ncbi:trypsin-like serine protease (plasmid) [Rhizobium ruizarguesonis]|nr:trypsin-like serine protease [Rhizobium ruizarguesonis]
MRKPGLLEYGSPAYSQTSTVWIEVKVSDSEIECCTGVLVGLHWVLTAEQCLFQRRSRDRLRPGRKWQGSGRRPCQDGGN